jgi:hypothetical protein
METTRGAPSGTWIAAAASEIARLISPSTTPSSAAAPSSSRLRAGPHAGAAHHPARRAQIRPPDRLPDLASGLGMDLCDYFDEISRKTKHIQFNRHIIKELKIKPLPRKFNPGEDPQQNGLYVLGSGMMVENTPSYALAAGMLGHARNTIGFVGYCDPETPGGELLATKPARPSCSRRPT